MKIILQNWFLMTRKDMISVQHINILWWWVSKHHTAYFHARASSILLLTLVCRSQTHITNNNNTAGPSSAFKSVRCDCDGAQVCSGTTDHVLPQSIRMFKRCCRKLHLVRRKNTQTRMSVWRRCGSWLSCRVGVLQCIKGPKVHRWILFELWYQCL